ncbi:MAG TPA: hypothetical protein VG096_18620 [Bryobacteraceae bacterium]|jgi:hypothetical protein|nr:hypothetical protein [Bryobacteraceae bacterium]
MGLGDITRQIAQQALKAPMKEVLESLRPPDAAALFDSFKATRPPSGGGDNVGLIILAQIQFMQKALKEDEELLVLLDNGLETMRVMELYAPSWSVAVLTGFDSERNLTRVIAPVERLELVCKVMKVAPGGQPVKVSLIAPKPHTPPAPG